MSEITTILVKDRNKKILNTRNTQNIVNTQSTKNIVNTRNLLNTQKTSYVNTCNVSYLNQNSNNICNTTQFTKSDIKKNP